MRTKDVEASFSGCYLVVTSFLRPTNQTLSSSSSEVGHETNL